MHESSRPGPGDGRPAAGDLLGRDLDPAEVGRLAVGRREAGAVRRGCERRREEP